MGFGRDLDYNKFDTFNITTLSLLRTDLFKDLALKVRRVGRQYDSNANMRKQISSQKIYS